MEINFAGFTGLTREYGYDGPKSRKGKSSDIAAFTLSILIARFDLHTKKGT